MGEDFVANAFGNATAFTQPIQEFITRNAWGCLLYTSDAADERSSVDLGGRRIIKKKKDSNRGS